MYWHYTICTGTILYALALYYMYWHYTICTGAILYALALYYMYWQSVSYLRIVDVGTRRRAHFYAAFHTKLYSHTHTHTHTHTHEVSINALATSVRNMP